MKLGISRPSETVEQAYEVFAAAQRWGFEGVQIKPHQYQPYLADQAAFARVYGALAPLAAGGMIVYLGADMRRWLEIVSPMIPFATAIGAEGLCLVAGVERGDGSASRFREVAQLLAQIGDRAQAASTHISLHNHANCLFESEDDLARLFEHLEPAQCGFTLDTAHAARSGITDVAHLARRFQAYLTNVHLKDLSQDNRFCPLGLGTLDLDAVLETLAEIGYDRWLVVDEESADYSTDDAYRLSREFLDPRLMRA